MRKALTAQSVLRIKPNPAKRLELPDAIVPGLYLVVQPSGKKSWAVRYRYRGKPRKFTIGRLGVFTLHDAREHARKALQALADGRDPCLEKRTSREILLSEGASHDDLVSTQVAAFLARYVRQQARPRTAAETERRFEKHVLPKWGTRRVQEITRRDVVELLDGIVDNGAPISANRTLTSLKTFFGWLIDRSVLDQSPCARVKSPSAEVSRERVLSNHELRLLWKATENLGYPYGSFTQLLLLTAQRRDEVSGLRRSELKSQDLWTISGSRTKNGLEHDVPLAPWTSAIVAAAPCIGTSKDFIFTVNGEAPISGYSGAKRKLETWMRDLGGEGGNASTPEISRWTFHDLRRTTASGMARLGIPVHLIEAVLNHTGGEISGVSAVYNRYKYLDEKRWALESWAEHVRQVVHG